MSFVRRDPFVMSFCMTFSAMWRSTARLCGALSRRVLSILVHDDVQTPVQLVLHTPMRAHDLVEAFRRECRAEQVIGRLGGGLVGGLANADDLADGREAGPFMMLLQPADVGADRRRAGLDAAVIAIDNR